jgi:DNA-nicking Smr family endonuclease
MSDVIDMYIDYASESTDAPSIYHRVLAYWIVSTVLGRYVRVITSYAPMGIRPNIWVILIGPSRIVRKTTAMRLATNIVREIAPQLLRKASFTPEALYEMCNELNPGDCIAWVKDEIGGFFRSLEKKYMFGIRELLSSMYMGEGEERILRNLKLRIPDDLYVTSVATLPTPPHNYLTEEDFLSGFMNRWILVYAMRREKYLPLLHQSMRAEALRREIISKLKELDKSLSSIAPIISPTSQAINKLQEYEQETERQIETIERIAPTSIFKEYLSETVQIFMKLAVLRRLARGDYDPSGLIVLEREDVDRARQDLDMFIESARHVINDVQSSPRSKPVLTEEKAIERVFNYISSKGEEGASYSELLVKLGILSKDLKEYVLTLMEQDRVICVRVHHGRGRPALKFFDKRYQSTALLKGQQITDDTLRVLLK